MTLQPFQFQADPQQASMTISRGFAAPRALVWDCYSKPELLDRWYAPSPLTAKTKTMDFRPGGHWHFSMVTPDGQEYWSRLDYLAISPIDGYTGFDGFSNPDGDMLDDMPISRQDLRFRAVEGGTQVVCQVQYDSAEDLQKVVDMGVETGVASTMQRLADLLAELS